MKPHCTLGPLFTEQSQAEDSAPPPFYWWGKFSALGPSSALVASTFPGRLILGTALVIPRQLQSLLEQQVDPVHQSRHHR